MPLEVVQLHVLRSQELRLTGPQVNINLKSSAIQSYNTIICGSHDQQNQSAGKMGPELEVYVGGTLRFFEGDEYIAPAIKRRCKAT